MVILRPRQPHPLIYDYFRSGQSSEGIAPKTSQEKTIKQVPLGTLKINSVRHVQILVDLKAFTLEAISRHYKPCRC
jgi:hypothetical protein